MLDVFKKIDWKKSRFKEKWIERKLELSSLESDINNGVDAKIKPFSYR